MKMKKFEFIERVNIYFTVEAENQEEAWQKLDQVKIPYDSIREVADVDILECFINYEWEIEND